MLTPCGLHDRQMVLLGAGFLELTDPERKWALALAAGAALVALGFAATVVVMSLGLGLYLAFQYFVSTWAGLGADLGLIAAGYVYCARPRRRSTSWQQRPYHARTSRRRQEQTTATPAARCTRGR